MIIKRIMKIMLAGIISIVILCIMFSFYYLLPVHKNSELGNTDYVWPKNSVWIKMTEGISYGKFDSQGFNNLEVINNPDILILGSSHMEATNVMQDENLGYILHEKIRGGGNKTVYNMGISGHHFAKVLQYLPKTLSLYEKSPEFIIIETSSISLNSKRVDDILKSKIEVTPSYNKGIIYFLQKMSFFRILYSQVKDGLLDLFLPSKKMKVENVVEKKVENENKDYSYYDRILLYLDSLQSKYNTKFIIFYHPTGKINKDGSVYFGENKELKIFSEKSIENNIIFIDMTKPFEKMYKTEHKLPHGFITGKISCGHINADGHRAVADELYKVIMTNMEVK